MTPVIGAPVISQMTPRSVQPGSTTEVTITGTELTSPLNVWTSFQATVKVIPTPEGMDDSKTARLAITLDAEIQVGVAAVAVSNAQGISPIFMVLVDDLTNVTDAGSNTNRKTPQLLELPGSVAGQSGGTTHDYYSFEVVAGQQLSFDILASRIASPMDPVLRLYNPSGQEVAFADDDAGLNADCRFRQTFSTAGTYLLEVADSAYKAGHPYLLRIGDFPLATTSFPVGIQSGVEKSLEFTGPAVGEAHATRMFQEGRPSGSFVSVSARAETSDSSGLALGVATDTVQSQEQEPNDDLKQASPAILPGGVSGRFDRPGDIDFYQFKAEKGQRFRFRGYSRSLGSPAIVKYRVLKLDGTQLADAPLTDEDEFVVAWVAPEAGEFLLEATDLLRRGGNNYGYLIHAELGSTFRLDLKNDAASKNQYLVDAGRGAIRFSVTVVRDGYDGPITVTTGNDIPGLQWFQNVIPKGGKAATVTVRFPADTKAGTLVNFQIVGEAEIDGNVVQVPLTSRDWLRTKFVMLSYPPTFLDGLFQYATVPAIDEFFEPALNPAIAYVPRGTTSAVLTMTTKSKLEAFKGALSPFYEDISEGISVAGKDDKGTHTITVTVPDNLTDETVKDKSFTVTAFADHAGHGQIVTRTVPIQIVDPLLVTVELPAGIEVGKSQKAKITIVRGPGSKAEAVAISVEGLPANLSVPKELMIAADKTELEFEIAASAEAVVATTEGVLVTAKSKYAGKDVQSSSNKIAVEVKAVE